MNQEQRNQLIRTQLNIAIQSQVAAQQAIEAAFLLLENDHDQEPSCEHPEGKRNYQTPAMFKCNICGKLIENGKEVT